MFEMLGGRLVIHKYKMCVSHIRISIFFPDVFPNPANSEEKPVCLKDTICEKGSLSYVLQIYWFRTRADSPSFLIQAPAPVLYMIHWWCVCVVFKPLLL